MVVGGDAARRFEAGLGQPGVEQLPVLGVLDGLDRRPEDADAVLREDARLGQGDAAVEGGLAAEREEDAVRLLPGDDLLDEIGRHRAGNRSCRPGIPRSGSWRCWG